MKKTKRIDGALPCLLFEPDERSGDLLPMIVFLHGWGERRGDEAAETALDTLEKCGLPSVAAGDRLPAVCSEKFLIVAPQAEANWDPPIDDERLLRLIDEVGKKHRADPRRCYLTGLSSGGTAVWKLAASDPDSFAALAPMSPENGKIPDEAERSSELPTWVFAGEDEAGYRTIKARVDELVAGGADVKLHSEPGCGHERRLWRKLYKRPDLYEWLLRHRR